MESKISRSSSRARISPRPLVVPVLASVSSMSSWIWISTGLQTFGLTNSRDACNQLALIWGVEPYMHEGGGSTKEMLREGEKTLLSAGVVEPGETLVMMAGRLSGLGLSSSVIVWTIGEDVPRR